MIAKDTTGIVEAIRQLRVACDGAVKARSAALNALDGLTVSAPDELRQQLVIRKTTRGRATLCVRFRPDPARLHEPTKAAKAALRSLARRVIELDAEIAVLDRQLSAGTLLVTAGQSIERLRSEASFAALCGARPIPVSTGRTDRHRLDYGGDRNANRALPRGPRDAPARSSSSSAVPDRSAGPSALDIIGTSQPASHRRPREPLAPRQRQQPTGPKGPDRPSHRAGGAGAACRVPSPSLMPSLASAHAGSTPPGQRPRAVPARVRVASPSWST